MRDMNWPEIRGSSPLARGLRRGRRGPPWRQGIIPARAGFTPTCSTPSSSTQDHPRSRGVYSSTSADARNRAGSSPLARGLRVLRRRYVGVSRIIPARAGFTKAGAAVRLLVGDHPRSRGVYRRALSAGAPMSGSSPLARGLHSEASEGRTLSGIIPARAGFTRQPSHFTRESMDHPRSRGVYSRPWPRSRGCAGSSPLARGLHVRAALVIPLVGIIPARAGFTIELIRFGDPDGDHPRSRGVYAAAASTEQRIGGSSPLARGLPARNLGRRAVGGIIPARAGFTSAGAPGRSAAWDHPRSRGVYPGPGPAPICGWRIIPARAGFTSSGT